MSAVIIVVMDGFLLCDVRVDDRKLASGVSNSLGSVNGNWRHCYINIPERYLSKFCDERLLAALPPTQAPPPSIPHPNCRGDPPTLSDNP